MAYFSKQTLKTKVSPVSNRSSHVKCGEYNTMLLQRICSNFRLEVMLLPEQQLHRHTTTISLWIPNIILKQIDWYTLLAICFRVNHQVVIGVDMKYHKPLESIGLVFYAALDAWLSKFNSTYFLW